MLNNHDKNISRSINYLLSTTLFFILGLSSFSQNPSVGALKTNQDIRKKYIDFSSTDPKNTSKSLYVDPFIGTGGHGHTYPGASAPFGMIQLSPDTRYEGWDGCSGYHYSDSIIFGFSHTHLSGTGVPDYCDLLLVPQSGIAKTTPGYLDSKNGYGSKFSHEQENASPGFYEVKLLDQNINVRLTVGERAGIHEYTFLNNKGKKYILIDLDHRDKLLFSSLNIINKQSISGSRVSEAWATNQHFYFYLQTSVPYQKATRIFKNGQHKLLLTFPESTQQILVKVGMSAVDEKGAKQNLEKEIPDWSFDALRAETVKKWNKELDKIDFHTKDKSVMVNFYTALYHSFLQPNVFSDIDGRYRGRDNQIHTISDNIPQYTVFSLWDTYRAAHPLYTIIQQKKTNEFIHTFLRQFEQGGDLPVWELAGNETDCMIGYHSASVIADAYFKGLRGFDANKALDAMVFTSRIDELGKNQFRSKGFISSGDEPESVSKTLEYAYDDFCISQMARDLNNNDLYLEYMKSSLNFLNLFDPKTKFMRARRDGLWYTPFDPSEVNFNYTEANSWQYSLYAPHAITLLSDFMGGKDSLENWLDRLFTTEMKLSGRHQVDITGLIGQYAHGNEPSHHMAYLYNYTNTSHKTQYYIDRIQKEMYSPQPDGLSGNEDCGQMSAWYVLSALGFYQVTPGHPWYDFGRPMMDNATIHLENGKKLVIKTVNNSPENKYIQSITFDGKPWIFNNVHHESLMHGGEIIFTMGPEPETSKRVINISALNKFPIDPILSSGFIPSPFFTVNERIFDDALKVSIGHHEPLNDESVSIEYRYLNDTNNIITYTKPFVLNKSASIETRRVNVFSPKTRDAFHSATHYTYSPWVRGDFIKRDNTVSLILNSEYSNQYAASGPNTLIDGVQGSNEFRTGDYQGYWAQDLVAEVSFTEPRILKEIGISCIQDMKSWIFYPSSVEIEISYDGINFVKLPPIKDIPQYEEYVGPNNMDFMQQTNSDKAILKIRIKAYNFGKCPDWHLGAGNDTWLFADELIFR